MGVWGAAIQGVLGADSSIQGGIADGKQTAANIELAGDAAADALRRGATEAGQARADASQVQRAQFVAYSSSGVDASVGTAANVIASTAAQGAREADNIENNAMREAWGFKKHGIAFTAQAGLNSARRNRELAGTVIGAAGNVASEYAKSTAKKPGGEF